MRYAAVTLALVVCSLSGCTQHQINSWNAALIGISEGIDQAAYNYRRQQIVNAYVQSLRRR